jgi:hypothetical protein
MATKIRRISDSAYIVYRKGDRTAPRPPVPEQPRPLVIHRLYIDGKPTDDYYWPREVDDFLRGFNSLGPGPVAKLVAIEYRPVS